MEKPGFSPKIIRPKRKPSITSFFAAAALAVLAGCTQIKYIKLNIKCNHPNSNTLCITGDVEHKCATKVLQDWAKARCKKAQVFKNPDGSKCVKCLE